MTDDDIRSLIRYQYDRGSETPSPMAEVIFKIACAVRDRVQTWDESIVAANLREKLKGAEESAKRAWQAYKELDNREGWRDRYYRLHKIHVEDVRRRKEVRRFRLASFSIEEMRKELHRRHADFQPAIWVPIDDGEYDDVLKSSRVQIENEGREVGISKRTKASVTTGRIFPHAGVRLCRQLEGEKE